MFAGSLFHASINAARSCSGVALGLFLRHLTWNLLRSRKNKSIACSLRVLVLLSAATGLPLLPEGVRKGTAPVTMSVRLVEGIIPSFCWFLGPLACTAICSASSLGVTRTLPNLRFLPVKPNPSNINVAKPTASSIVVASSIGVSVTPVAIAVSSKPRMVV